MFTLLPRRIIIILIFFFALGTLGLWYLLSFSPPQNVQVTDQTDSSAVVVWNTVKPSTSNVYYTTHPFLLRLLPLTFLATSLTRSHELTINHRLLLTNLGANQTYYLAISNWFHFYSTQRVTTTGLNNGFWQRISSVSLPTIKTSSSVILGNPPEAGDSRIDSGQVLRPRAQDRGARMTNVKGIVTNKKLQPVSNVLVITKTVSGQSYSVLTDQKGNFSLSLPLTDKDALVFVTAQNGVGQQKTLMVRGEILNQPVLIRLP